MDNFNQGGLIRGLEQVKMLAADTFCSFATKLLLHYTTSTCFSSRIMVD